MVFHYRTFRQKKRNPSLNGARDDLLERYLNESERNNNRKSASSYDPHKTIQSILMLQKVHYDGYSSDGSDDALMASVVAARDPNMADSVCKNALEAAPEVKSTEANY